ncbi:MAG: hypothetical protein AAF739_14980 [Pseudomonadota bacterium]
MSALQTEGPWVDPKPQLLDIIAAFDGVVGVAGGALTLTAVWTSPLAGEMLSVLVQGELYA